MDSTSKMPGESERVARVDVWRRSDNSLVADQDDLTVEEPLEIRVDGASAVVTMRTPGDDPYLALGFLLGEGIIHSLDDVRSVEPVPDRDGFPQPNVLDVRLARPSERPERLWQRNVYMTSSCGLCGRASIEAVHLHAPPVGSFATVEATVLLGLEAKLRPKQEVFRRTGGLHAAGLFDLAGDLVALHEDVGRHNAVDKLFGQMLAERRLPLAETILLVSGRASFELLQKAVLAGVPIFAAVGAPSSLAVEMAGASNVTLVGMLRAPRFVVYAGRDRIR